MGKLKDNFANQSKGYITFCDFFEFLCDFTSDNPKDVISYLAIQQEFRKLNYYFIIHNYPNVEIIKRAYDALSERDEYPIDDFIDRVMFDNGVIYTETEETFLDNYFKIDEVFELGFLAEIGLNTERYYSHKRALQHGIELGIIDKNGIEIDKPSDLQQQLADLEKQLASAGDTIDQQTKEIADLKAKLTSIEAGKDTQKDTPADNEPKYTTTAITALNHVIREFWQDWTQGTTPPKQAHIVKWITDNYPSINRTTATNIDRIARHESLK
nr:hypothetical protein [Moraxella osloensis]